MLRTQRAHQRERGTVAVEFGLVLTFLVLMISAALEGGLNMAQRHAIVTAARAGAVAGSVTQVSNATHIANANASATARLTELGFARAGEFTVNSTIDTGHTPNQLTVTVTHKYKHLFPLLPASNRNMTTSVTMPLGN